VTKRTTFAVVLAGSVAAAGIGTAQGPREAAAVRAARAAQNTALAQHDLDRVASFWTDDIVIRSGLGRVIDSKTAYKNAFAGDSDLVYNREPDRVDVSNNDRWPLAFESGVWTARVNGSGRPIIRGRYAAQWIKRNGKWLIRSEVFVALTCTGRGCSRPIVGP
jgi:ketosteroid isomerase-like protein